MRMKKLFTFIFILLLAIFPTVAAAGEDNHNRSIDQVLAEIIQTQNVSSLREIDCESVTDNEFENLGEVVMGVLHPDSKQHKLMDQMMGGEGSESLRAMHINMGQNYLDCGSGGFGMMSCASTMGGGMMNSMGIMGGGRMMGDFFPKVGTLLNQTRQIAGDEEVSSMMGFPFMGVGLGMGFGWIFMILFWILVIAGIVWLTRFQSGKNTGQNFLENNALGILKERYAKGEITSKEFEKMRKDIR